MLADFGTLVWPHWVKKTNMLSEDVGDPGGPAALARRGLEDHRGVDNLAEPAVTGWEQGVQVTGRVSVHWKV